MDPPPPVIDEAALRAFLDEVGAEITRGLGLEEVTITLERLASLEAIEHGKHEVDWYADLVNLVPRPPPHDGHLPLQPFGLTRDELSVIEAGLKDVVGDDYRAYPQISGRKPAIWRAFVLVGARGCYRLEFWRCD